MECGIRTDGGNVHGSIASNGAVASISKMHERPVNHGKLEHFRRAPNCRVGSHRSDFFAVGVVPEQLICALSL